MKKLFITLFFASFLVACGVENQDDDVELVRVKERGLWGGPAWIAENQWNDEMENAYSDWIEKLGTARESRKCIKLAECLKTPEANSLYSVADESLSIHADCADVPYTLRSYFAEKMSLPFVMTSEIESESGFDLRYSLGNHPMDWKSNMNFKNFNSIIYVVNNWLASGFFRMEPTLEKTDTFPIDPSKNTVRPGTVFYIPDGHVAVVYKVEDDGNIKLFDGHPDNSFTIATSLDKFFNDPQTEWWKSSRGAGFRNWRWHNISSDGNIEFQTNEELSSRGLSDSQYPGRSHIYDLGNGEKGNYKEWIKVKLSGSSKIFPEKEMVKNMDILCNETIARADAVNMAIELGLDKESHPGVPSNIYATYGDWESYSTPGRDIRYRQLYNSLYEFIEKSVDGVKSGDSNYQYDGTVDELLNEYGEIWNEKASECTFSYKNSSNNPVALNIHDILERLYDLSFDPYACIEQRWGAYPEKGDSSAHPEHSSCKKDALKEYYYWYESRWRNALVKSSEAVTNPEDEPLTPKNLDIPALIATLVEEGGSENGGGNDDEDEPEEIEIVKIESFPFSHSANSEDGTRLFDFDSSDTCKPNSGDEKGGEIVYSLIVSEEGVIKASITDGSGVDIDIHLLSSLDEKDCIARHDREIDEVIAPGTYYIVADSWRSSGGTIYEGDFEINVDFTPSVDDAPQYEVSTDRAGNYTSESAQHELWKIVTSTLNCRVGPGTENRKVAIIRDTDTIKSLNNSKMSSYGTPWFEMELSNGLHCFARAKDRYITPFR